MLGSSDCHHIQYDMIHTHLENIQITKAIQHKVETILFEKIFWKQNFD